MKEDHRSHKARQVLEGMRQRLTRQMVLTLTSCTHCGLCSDSCHYVLTNPGDPTYTPAHKADQIRKFFNRHVDWTGRVLPWWVRAQTLRNDEDLEQLKDTLFGKCTNCRRCTINCPMGVDFATVNRMVRGLLVSVGIMPEGVAVVSKDQWEMGNQMGVLPEEYLETLDWMDEEVRDELGLEHRLIAMDKMDADFMYTVNPREIKYDPRTIADATKIFTLAGENWTMASEGWDMTNFGLFSGDDALGGTVAGRVYEKAKELRARRVVISECGHGYRSTRCEGSNWNGVEAGVQMESAIVTMIRYIREGRIQVDKARNTTPVTYHDPCNNARSCGLYEEPRELISLTCSDFREMIPNRAENYCCTGGGGAMAMSEYTPRRLKSAAIKAEQIKATGAGIVLTSCHNCIDGLTDLVRHYKLGVEVKLLVNMVANALVIPERVEVEEKPPVLHTLRGFKILIIDDEPDTVAYLSMVLEDNEAETRQATDGPSGIEIARRERPSLITLDLSMPGMDGGEVFVRLREDPETKEIPICIMTGRPELRKLIYDKPHRPPEGYLDKPVEPENFIKNVRKILELHSREKT